jgi:hypothetical protein
VKTKGARERSYGFDDEAMEVLGCVGIRAGVGRMLVSGVWPGLGLRPPR